MRTRRWSGLAVVVAVGFGAGAVACGEHGGEVGAGDPGFLSQAVAKLQDASTGRIGGEFAMEIHGQRSVGTPVDEDEPSEDVSAAMRGELEGAFDLGASASSAAMIVTELDTSEPSRRDPEVGERYEVVRSGEDVFSREVGADGDAESWRRRDRSPSAAAYSAMYLGFDDDGFTDPERLLRDLDRGAVEITETGTGEVGGVEVIHYRVSLSLARLTEVAEEERARAAADDRNPMSSAWYEEELRSYREAVATITIPVEVAIDGSGYIRSISSDLDVLELSRRVEAARQERTGTTSFGIGYLDGLSQRVVYRIEFYDLGEPVSIEVPDASEVDDDRAYGRFEDIGSLTDCETFDDGTYECFDSIGSAVEGSSPPIPEGFGELPDPEVMQERLAACLESVGLDPAIAGPAAGDGPFSWLEAMDDEWFSTHLASGSAQEQDRFTRCITEAVLGVAPGDMFEDIGMSDRGSGS